MKFKFQHLIEQAYENIVNSGDDEKKRTQLIYHIQDLLNAGDPDGVLQNLSIEQLQNIYNELLRSHKEVQAAIDDWNEDWSKKE